MLHLHKFLPNVDGPLQKKRKLISCFFLVSFFLWKVLLVLFYLLFFFLTLDPFPSALFLSRFVFSLSFFFLLSLFLFVGFGLFDFVLVFGFFFVSFFSFILSHLIQSSSFENVQNKKGTPLLFHKAYTL